MDQSSCERATQPSDLAARFSPWLGLAGAHKVAFPSMGNACPRANAWMGGGRLRRRASAACLHCRCFQQRQGKNNLTSLEGLYFVSGRVPTESLLRSRRRALAHSAPPAAAAVLAFGTQMGNLITGVSGGAERASERLLVCCPEEKMWVSLLRSLGLGRSHRPRSIGFEGCAHWKKQQVARSSRPRTPPPPLPACDQSGAQQQPEKPDALQLYNSQVALCWIERCLFPRVCFVCAWRGEFPAQSLTSPPDPFRFLWNCVLPWPMRRIHSFCRPTPTEAQSAMWNIRDEVFVWVSRGFSKELRFLWNNLSLFACCPLCILAHGVDFFTFDLWKERIFLRLMHVFVARGGHFCWCAVISKHDFVWLLTPSPN